MSRVARRPLPPGIGGWLLALLGFLWGGALACGSSPLYESRTPSCQLDSWVFAGDWLLATCDGGEGIAIDFERGQAKRLRVGPEPGRVRDIALNPAGDLAVLASEGWVTLFDDDFEVIGRFRPPDSAVAIAWNRGLWQALAADTVFSYEPATRALEQRDLPRPERDPQREVELLGARLLDGIWWRAFRSYEYAEVDERTIRTTLQWKEPGPVVFFEVSETGERRELGEILTLRVPSIVFPELPPSVRDGGFRPVFPLAACQRLVYLRPDGAATFDRCPMEEGDPDLTIRLDDRSIWLSHSSGDYFLETSDGLRTATGFGLRLHDFVVHPDGHVLVFRDDMRRVRMFGSDLELVADRWIEYGLPAIEAPANR